MIALSNRERAVAILSGEIVLAILAKMAWESIQFSPVGVVLHRLLSGARTLERILEACRVLRQRISE